MVRTPFSLAWNVAAGYVPLPFASCRFAITVVAHHLNRLRSPRRILYARLRTFHVRITCLVNASPVGTCRWTVRSPMADNRNSAQFNS